MSIHGTLTTFLSDFENDLPPLLALSGVTNFDNYAIGSSRDPQEKACLIYHDDSNISVENDTGDIIVQFQLYSETELNAAIYTDVFTDYILDYDPHKIGFDTLDNVNINSWPVDGNETALVFFILSYKKDKDSCD